MHSFDFTSFTTLSLNFRILELQHGPSDEGDAVGFYCPEEECPWNSLDAIEAELVRRERVIR